MHHDSNDNDKDTNRAQSGTTTTTGSTGVAVAETTPGDDVNKKEMPPQPLVVGVSGVRLKHFERVVASILPEVQPRFVQLPSPSILATSPHDNGRSSNNSININSNSTGTSSTIDDLYQALPAAARVYGNLPGQLSHRLRATRKEQQVLSMLRCILALIPPRCHVHHNASIITASCSINSNATPSSRQGRQGRHPYTIVDFGGGSGHVAIPLALLLPSCRIICVDLGARTLDLLHTKADECMLSMSASVDGVVAGETISLKGDDRTTPLVIRPTAIPNLDTFCGSAEAWHALTLAHGQEVSDDSDGAAKLLPCWPSRLDMAVALHLCGEATDVVLRIAGKGRTRQQGQQQTSATASSLYDGDSEGEVDGNSAATLVVAPCCVGKLSAATKNPYVYQATGSNAPTVSYPQSQLFCQLIGTASNALSGVEQSAGGSTNSSTAVAPTSRSESTDDDTLGGTGTVSQQSDWNAMAKAADYSSEDRTECRTGRQATRRTAKALLELDRQLYLQETYGYETALTRMEPWEASPKNDIIMAWRRRHDTSEEIHNAVSAHDALRDDAHWKPNIATAVDEACQADIAATIDFLLRQPTTSSLPVTNADKVCNKDSASSSSLVQSFTSTADATAGSNSSSAGVDWSQKEEVEIRRVLTKFVKLIAEEQEHEATTYACNLVLVFPTRMGGRQRKLVHYVAEQMGLAHWCQGKKYAEKTVAVATKGRQRQATDRIVHPDAIASL